MAKYLFPGVGGLDTENLESEYNGAINFYGREIRIDLNFEAFQIGVDKLDSAKAILINIEDMDKKNKQYMEADYLDIHKDTVKSYLEHHLKEIDHKDLSDLINFEENAMSNEEQLIKELKLVRVGLYPENEDQFAVFDYTIGEELTQYLIVVNLEKDGQLESLSMES